MGPCDPAAVVQTHAAILFFVGDRVYKLKKPVDLGFLDFRRRRDRESVCHREVHLNRRLAPDVYLGVADVHGPDGAPCDHLVVMRRMPADRRLSTLVTSGAPVTGHLRRLARALAAFHATAGRGPDVAAALSAAAQPWPEAHTVATDHDPDDSISRALRLIGVSTPPAGRASAGSDDPGPAGGSRASLAATWTA